MVSVIMLTYNREKYVKKMIEDIINQTYTEFEFIIIDNGSSDESGTIADDYQKKDDRIKVFHLPEPHSIGFARNYGVCKSQGEYIAFVDDDDRVDNEFLEFLVELMTENNADISMCGATEGDGITRNPQCLFDEKMVINGEEAVRMLIDRKYIRAGMPTKLYRRQILEAYPFVENYKNEDIHTQYKYLLMSKVVAIHGVDHYYITRHASNVSGFTSDAGKWDSRTMQDYLDAYHNRTAFIQKNAPDTYDMALYSEWSFMISMLNKIDIFCLEDCKQIGVEMAKILRDNKDQFLSMPYIKEFEKIWADKYLVE